MQEVASSLTSSSSPILSFTNLFHYVDTERLAANYQLIYGSTKLVP